MTRFVLTKIFHAIITFVLSGIVIFFGVRMLPGDPALAMAGEEATPSGSTLSVPTSVSTSL